MTDEPHGLVSFSITKWDNSLLLQLKKSENEKKVKSEKAKSKNQNRKYELSKTIQIIIIF